MQPGVREVRDAIRHEADCTMRRVGQAKLGLDNRGPRRQTSRIARHVVAFVAVAVLAAARSGECRDRGAAVCVHQDPCGREEGVVPPLARREGGRRLFQKCKDKLGDPERGAFARAERRGGCLTHDDAPDVESTVDAFADGVAALGVGTPSDSTRSAG
jgi:hypothetical protein